MKAIKFKEATIELKKPASMTDEECSSLFISQPIEGLCVSCWTTSFWERLKFLFHGKIWLGVYSGKTQPPVWLDCRESTFNKPDVLTTLGFINQFFIQWFFIRIFSNQIEGVHKNYGILYFVFPLTGWNSEYKSIGKIKYKHFK